MKRSEFTQASGFIGSSRSDEDDPARALTRWLPRRSGLMLAVLLLTAASSSPYAFNLTRDAFGVPHVNSTTDTGAFYGVGVAQAEDRLYQLLTQRVAARGRVAECFGPGAAAVNTASDVRVRTLGWTQYAERVVAAMPPADLALLQAYADGVNAYLRRQGPPALALQNGVPATNWTAADSVLVWLRLSSFFAPDGLKKAAKLANAEVLAAKLGWPAALKQLSCGPHGDKGPCRVHDPAGTSMLEADADPAWLKRVNAFAAAHWPPGGSTSTSAYATQFAFPALLDEDQPRFSHGEDVVNASVVEMVGSGVR